MKCAVCGKPCDVQLHTFYVGTCPKSLTRGEGPAALWQVSAPLYYKAKGAFSEMEAPFCSAKCSLEWTNAANTSPH